MPVGSIGHDRTLGVGKAPLVRPSNVLDLLYGFLVDTGLDLLSLVVLVTESYRSLSCLVFVIFQEEVKGLGRVVKSSCSIDTGHEVKGDESLIKLARAALLQQKLIHNAYAGINRIL